MGTNYRQGQPHQGGFVRRWLVALVDAACCRPRLVLCLAAGLCVLSAVGAVCKLQYRTQRDDLVSEHKEYQKRWQRYQAEFGEDNDMVVVVKGHGTSRMKAALESVASRVARQPERFDRLFYKVDLRSL